MDEFEQYCEKIKPGKWRHFKGNEYRVLSVARHSETLAPMVVYQALYGEQGVWVRPPKCGWKQLSGMERHSRALPISATDRARGDR